MNGERLHSQPVGQSDAFVHMFVQKLPDPFDDENCTHLPSAHSLLSVHDSPRGLFPLCPPLLLVLLLEELDELLDELDRTPPE